jgi:hypothetical protein
MGYKRLRSRKELITVTTWVPTPEDIKRALANRGALNHEESGYTKITVGEAIRTQIADFRKFATAAIGREGKDPSRYQAIIEGSEFADRAFCAALILKNLDDVEKSLVDVEEWGDRETALDALFLALECAYYSRLLTITSWARKLQKLCGRVAARPMRRGANGAAVSGLDGISRPLTYGSGIPICRGKLLRTSLSLSSNSMTMRGLSPSG